MNKIGSNTKPMISTDALIWEAQLATRDLELANKKDSRVESENRFKEAIDARNAATDARFAKGEKDNKKSLATTIFSIIGLGVAVAAAFALPVFGVAALAAGAIVAAISFAGVGVPKIVFEHTLNSNNDERQASRSDLQATEAQRAADEANDEAQAAQDRFRSMIDDARAMDQLRLRLLQKD